MSETKQYRMSFRKYVERYIRPEMALLLEQIKADALEIEKQQAADSAAEVKQ